MLNGLTLATWLRFIFWFLIGITIYALYGYHNAGGARDK
jgi:hypothetical protein